MRSGLLLVAMALVAAPGTHIGRAEPAAAKPPVPGRAPPPDPLDRDTMMRLHMHASFDLIRAIERLLISGKLDDAKRFAATISEPADAPAHGRWASQVVLVRDRAAAVARATTVAQACQLEAKLAAACGGCHVETSVVARFRGYPPAPPDLPTIGARMARHRWAVDRLWEGIVGGADEPWRAGLEVLAAAPLEWGDGIAARAQLARQLQRDAAQARAHVPVDESLDARASAYGAMLSTCAACHTSKPATAPTKP
jgi:cytochrome c553